MSPNIAEAITNAGNIVAAAFKGAPEPWASTLTAVALSSFLAKGLDWLCGRLGLTKSNENSRLKGQIEQLQLQHQPQHFQQQPEQQQPSGMSATLLQRLTWAPPSLGPQH